MFYGSVAYEYRGTGWFWSSILNGEDMGGYPTMARAKARVDWEVWNRIRQMRPAYEMVLARREEWKDGSG